MPDQEAPPTATPRRILILTLALLLGAAALSAPVWADTASELDAAKDRLEAARAALTQVTQQWQESEAELARARDAVNDAVSRIDQLEGQLATIRKSLNDRVAAAFMAGGAPSIGALLTADSIEEAADRLQYTQSVVQNDADLATEVGVTVEELRRQESRLRRAAKVQARAAADIEAQRDRIDERVQQLNDVVQELQAEFEAAQQRELGLQPGGSGGTGAPSVSITGTGAIQTCPVAGPTSFVDSFGDPRPGGRSHEGIDLIAAYGTPVVAVAPGSARPAGSIGGLGVVVQHGSGDWTFYAHLSSYGSLGSVSAGTVIGYVGPENGVNHLHFEYHPNGGAAVNPYAALLAVC
jgi:murein DD-endopeptidase MepM/ murein hydrolase activator NlpD